VEQVRSMDGGDMIFDLTVASSSFTMNFSKEEPFNATDKAACAPKENPIAKPETWTITNEEHRGKKLLVFNLLRQNATFMYVDGKRKGTPNGPHCELFVRFVSYFLDFLPFCSSIFIIFLIILFFQEYTRLQPARF